MFPKSIYKLTKEKAELVSKFFIESDGFFTFEGCWLRNQRPENKNQSNYVDESTVRRRYVHFYDKYQLINENGESYLALAKPYLHITNTLPENEISEMKTRILNVLKASQFKQNGNVFLKDNMEVDLFEYKVHPKNTTKFPNNYSSFDITIKLKDYKTDDLTNRMWLLSTKMYRMPDKRENPTYTDNLDEIKKYLPAQIEMGCGPSLEANIPPLYKMHELYKVQNHDTGKFYFASEDNLAEELIKNIDIMYRKFAEVPINCIEAELTDGYKTFGQLYNKGYLKGIVFNNNFDRLVRRMNINETILRIYDIDTYLPQCEFAEGVKSLICIGCHADRRQIQRQARQKGLKVIYIDPEGFYTDKGFEPYLIEGPKNEDYILKMTFEDAMRLFKRDFLL